MSETRKIAAIWPPMSSATAGWPGRTRIARCALRALRSDLIDPTSPSKRAHRQAHRRWRLVEFRSVVEPSAARSKFRTR